MNIHPITKILLALSLIFSSLACTREPFQTGSSGIFIDPADFELGWQYGDPVRISTRSEQSVEVENAVTNLYVLLADAHGDIIVIKSYWVTSGSSVPDGYDDIINNYSVKQSEDGEASRGTILRFFEKTDMTQYRNSGPFTFYAVANYSDAVGSGLAGAKTVSDIEGLTVTFSTAGNVNRTRFLMVAKEDGVALNINQDGQIERTGVNLELKRIDAKVKFNLSVEIPEALQGTTRFENMTYRVHRVPNVSYLFPREKENDSGQEWDAAAVEEADGDGISGYSCMLDDNYQTFDVTESDNTGGTFAFYLRENRPVPKREISEEEQGSFSSLYAMREAWNTDSSVNPADPTDNRVPVHGRKFTYAPENSTFVEISGNLSYTRRGQEGDEEVFGAVTYIVHLGETGNDPNNVEAVNNYDVRRNVNYIYNMRITGINNFVVEVTEEKELRPGAEGDVTVSTNRQVTMDAHYGRVLFQLDRTSIEAGAGWSVRTPIGEVSYNPETGLINSPYDYKWVLFAVNADFGVGPNVMVKFPGIQAYDGGVQFYEGYGEPKDDATIKAAIAADMGNNILYNGKPCTFKEYLDANRSDNNYYSPGNSTSRWNALTKHACLMDINQLINYLTWSLDDSNQNQGIFTKNADGHEIVTVTAFCDEYTYIYDPRVEDYVHPGESVAEMSTGEDDKKRRLLLWKAYADAGSRVMNITPMATTAYSPDGNTTLTNSYITITQNSIKTIYNPDFTDTAWGLETTNETGPLTHVTNRIGDNGPIHDNYNNEIGKRTNTLGDGRTNFLNFWVGTDRNGNDRQGTIFWTDAMNVNKDVENGNDLNVDYRNAFYACITRNRDLNGNNLIDADEIYWYLAARDQLTGLWIGQGAIDDEAWMYQGDGSEQNHLITSSHRPTGGNYWIIWAEEGASLGGLRISGDDEYEDAQGQPLPYDYRCVRNLGIDIAEKKAPEHFAGISDRIENGESDYYTVDASVINSRALRSSPDDGINLPLDNERSQNNTPFRSFDVRSSSITSNLGVMTWLEMADYLNRNMNPCPQGWRVPNQREVLIMASLVGENGFNLNSDYDRHLGIATSFSFNGKSLYANGERYGFIYGGDNVYLHNPGNSDRNNNGRVLLQFRCVRDHTGN